MLRNGVYKEMAFVNLRPIRNIKAHETRGERAKGTEKYIKQVQIDKQGSLKTA